MLVSLLFVQIYDGYFIHYFAPRGLPPVEKNVVFVIDVSGSMFGTKIKQVTRTLGTFHSSSFLRLSKQRVLEHWIPGARVRTIVSPLGFIGPGHVDLEPQNLRNIETLDYESFGARVLWYH